MAQREKVISCCLAILSCSGKSCGHDRLLAYELMGEACDGEKLLQKPEAGGGRCCNYGYKDAKAVWHWHCRKCRWPFRKLAITQTMFGENNLIDERMEGDPESNLLNTAHQEQIMERCNRVLLETILLLSGISPKPGAPIVNSSFMS